MRFKCCHESAGSVITPANSRKVKPTQSNDGTTDKTRNGSKMPTHQEWM